MWFVEWWQFMLSSFWIWAGSMGLLAVMATVFTGAFVKITKIIDSKDVNEG